MAECHLLKPAPATCNVSAFVNPEPYKARWLFRTKWIIFIQLIQSPPMNQSICKALSLAVVFQVLPPALAQTLDPIGLTLLRATTTNLNGTGIRVAQPEASGPGLNFQVNPGIAGQPTNLFIYSSRNGAATAFPNAVGGESGHANTVGGIFFGLPGGIATNVVLVDNYDAEFYVTNYVFTLSSAAAAVVNQSFTFGNVSTNLPTPFGYVSVNEQQQIDRAYDDYANMFATLFVSPANNGGTVSPPGTAYNCICVGAYGGSSSIGPTLDNGRCKPDITAPAGATSYSTPQVSGAATVLIQAARRGDGGSDTNAASDPRTIKALLLNGAVKPMNWTHSPVFPLDARYGAGVLNLFNSYRQLAGGMQFFSATNQIALDAVHPPETATNTVPGAIGWSFENISSSPTNDAVGHFLFNVTNVMVSATVVWNRPFGAAGVNDLDLFLYDCANSNLIASSISYVNNVEHLYVTNLAAGRYDLQVVKYGGTNVVSDVETFALAWQLLPPPSLSISQGTNPFLTWPIFPAGFVIEANTNLVTPGNWSTNQLPLTIFTNGQNTLVLNATNAAQFFRLRQP
jgi:hypothetical protein